METETTPPASTPSERLYQVRLKLIEYQLNKLQTGLKYYEEIGCIQSASLNEKRAKAGNLLLSLVNDVNRRTSGIQVVIEDLKHQDR
ncbi:hypothetical protein [Gynuella sunshinyii]|uniref:Uncharacterized protein n=1 Tax=Gynuella sunshinyii YC6258 TaxID=1445510 RepID=A0A0C5V9R0_9GAMM|nr:hypothetical protein [Gynuella sunshinyii]AJQ96095.1 hypothetical Protein YC6258_04059 [Gynuella sunshinyii YC6258]